MKTKCVYVLVSNENDYYYEQTLCSLYSLRLHNPCALVYIVVDENTEKTFTDKRAAICDYVTEVVGIDVPEEFNQMQKSRYLKTNLRDFIEGDFIFIDSDTIITSPLNLVDEFTFEIGAVADAHVCIGRHRMAKKIREWADVGGWSVDDKKPYFNSGVIYVKDSDTTHKFYKLWYHFWYENYKKGLSKDQSSLARTDAEMGYVMKDLGGEWNCQLIEGGLKYFGTAKILHYYAARSKSPYLFNRNETFDDLKKTGMLSDEIKNLILNPCSAFADDSMVISGTNKEMLKMAFSREYVQNMPPPLRKLLQLF